MNFTLRTANANDAGHLAELIAASVSGLAKGIYDDRQIDLSIRSVFGVDHQLITDGTYFVAECEGKIVGCGGWSKRKTPVWSEYLRRKPQPGIARSGD